MKELLAIQETAQQVVSATASAFGVEVAIIDEDYSLLATSKTFLEIRGEALNREYIQKVVRLGKAVVTNPGFNEFCAGCVNEKNCPETAEVLKTIEYNGKLIGLFLMIAYTHAQREKLLSNPKELFFFIEEMSNLLCSKITLMRTMKNEQILLKQFQTTLQHIDKGIITVDSTGKITQINKHAASIFQSESSTIIGENLESFIPLSKFSAVLEQNSIIKSKEIKTFSNKKIHCIFSANPVVLKGRQMGAVICISDFSDVRTDIYNISEQQIPFSFADIYGNSQDMHTLRRYAKQIAGTDSAILIRGESGTGKEVFARAIHNQSQRRTEPFVPINCAAIPESLLESELFGYEEGAFSGAKKGGKPGKFELANRGTLFLDEIGDMPLHMQIKLFRVLQDQCIERIGSLKSIPIDVRVISATNQELKNLITLKKFREELYFRLNVMPLNIPPLRERPEDIPDLAYFFLKKYNHKNNKSIETIDADVFDYLCAYSWPGNVRELENLMEYIVNMTFETRVTRDRLPSNILMEHDLHSRAGTLTERVKSYERMIIQKTMDKSQGSGDKKTKAASELGISLPTLYRKLRTK